MFSSLAYAIILMGCSDDMSLCQNKARDRRVYATMKECEQAEEAALISTAALEIDYPVVATKCIETNYRFTQRGSAHIGG